MPNDVKQTAASLATVLLELLEPKVLTPGGAMWAWDGGRATVEAMLADALEGALRLTAAPDGPPNPQA